MTDFKLAGIVSAIGLGLGYLLGGRSSKVMEAEEKPKLTPKQLEYLNEMKTNYNGYAYVKTDTRGWDGLKPNVLEQLIDKKIISIPKDLNKSFYGDVENHKAYSVVINPIALKYPYKEPKGYEHYGGALRGTDKFAQYMAKQQPSSQNSSSPSVQGEYAITYLESHNDAKNQHKYYLLLTSRKDNYTAYGRLPGYGREATMKLDKQSSASKMKELAMKKMKTYQLVGHKYDQIPSEIRAKLETEIGVKPSSPPAESNPQKEEPKKPMDARLAMAMKRRQMMGAEGTLYTAGKWRRPVKFRHLDDKNYDGAIELQGYGFSPAKLGENLQIGDVLVWNNGYKSRILDIQPKGKQSLVLKTMTQDTRYKKGEEFERTIRKNRLVGVAQDFHKFNGVMIGDLPPVAGQPQPQNARLAMAMKRRQMMKAETFENLNEKDMKDLFMRLANNEMANFGEVTFYEDDNVLKINNPQELRGGVNSGKITHNMIFNYLDNEMSLSNMGAGNPILDYVGEYEADQALLLDEEDDGELMAAEYSLEYSKSSNPSLNTDEWKLLNMIKASLYRQDRKTGEMLENAEYASINVDTRGGVYADKRKEIKSLYDKGIITIPRIKGLRYLSPEDFFGLNEDELDRVQNVNIKLNPIAWEYRFHADPQIVAEYSWLFDHQKGKGLIQRGNKIVKRAEYQPDQELSDYSVSEIAKSSAIEGYQPNKYSFGPISLGAESVSDLKLRKDSCCCGATKKTPCVCMILGSDCSAKKPMCACYRLKAIQEADKKAAETFEARGGKRMYCPSCKTNRTWNSAFKKRNVDYSKGEKPRDFIFYVCQKCDYAYDPKTSKEMDFNWRRKYGYDAESNNNNDWKEYLFETTMEKTLALKKDYEKTKPQYDFKIEAKPNSDAYSLLYRKKSKRKMGAESNDSDSMPIINPKHKTDAFKWIKKEGRHIKSDADKEMDEYDYTAMTFLPEELESGAVNALNAGDLEAAQTFVKALNRQKFIKAYQTEENR